MSTNKITISGHHVDLTQGMKDQVEKKLRPLVDKHHITDINVILDVEKNQHIAEANVHIPGHKTLHAKAITGDMYSSIDELEDKIVAQLDKEHSKKSDHHKDPSKKIMDTVKNPTIKKKRLKK